MAVYGDEAVGLHCVGILDTEYMSSREGSRLNIEVFNGIHKALS
jgi:hypothetical protein